MDASKFQQLPELTFRGHVFSELHVLLCTPPRPVVVRVPQGYRILPPSLWGVAEFIASVSQNLDVEEMPACGIYQFLGQLLAQVIASTGILKEACEVQGEGLLTLLLTKRRQANHKQLAISDGKMGDAHDGVGQFASKDGKIQKALQLATMD